MASKKQKLRKRISAGLIVFSLAAAGLFALLLTPLFSVKSIIVQGNQTVSQESIIKGSGIVEGTNIFDISLSRVRDNIEGMERISSVKVKRILPSAIKITVVEGAPIVYIYDNGDCVGITADGRVTDVVRAVSMPSAEPERKDEPEAEGEADENEEETASADENYESDGNDEETSNLKEADGEETESEYETIGLECAVVTGMGEMSYKVGGTVQFSDTVKSENLFKLLDEFLSDEICRNVTSVDMSRYDRVSFIYGGTLKVSVGAVENLSYKLKCFKTIVSEQLEEGSKGTLDLERLTYSPKNK